MPDPSVCGFPDVETVGVNPAIPRETVNGTVTLSTPGQVYENKTVIGAISVTAPNVTIRNVKLVITDEWYGIKAFGWVGDPSGLIVTDSEIDLNGMYTPKGIAFDGYTARRVFFHNGSDCAHFEHNVVIEDSLCVVGPDANSDGWPDNTSFCTATGDHFDGFQSDGGNSFVIRHNTIRNPCRQTSNILLSSNTKHISTATIDHNLLAGGGYSLYCAGMDDASTVDHIVATNNVYSKQYFPRGGYWGPAAYCDFADVYSNNVWDGNYVPPPGTGGGGGSATPGPGGAAHRLGFRRARQVTRTALARHLKRRYTGRPTKLRLSCKRRSAAVVRCNVRWTGTRLRYAGFVRVARVGQNALRYKLRVRARPSGCAACEGRLFKKSRRV
jgi:hypothetical protein